MRDALDLPSRVAEQLVSKVGQGPRGRDLLPDLRDPPGRLHTLLTAESVTAHAVNPVVSAADFASRARHATPTMTQHHERPVADR